MGCGQGFIMLRKKRKIPANNGTWDENTFSGQLNGRRLSILRNYFCSSLLLAMTLPLQAINNSSHMY